MRIIKKRGWKHQRFDKKSKYHIKVITLGRGGKVGWIDKKK